MRVDQSPSQSVVQINRTSASRATQPTTASAETSRTTGDHVKVSDAGNLLNLAKQLSNSRVKTVSELASAYRAGTYAPDVNAVSQKMATALTNRFD